MLVYFWCVWLLIDKLNISFFYGKVEKSTHAHSYARTHTHQNLCKLTHLSLLTAGLPVAVAPGWTQTQSNNTAQANLWSWGTESSGKTVKHTHIHTHTFTHLSQQTAIPDRGPDFGSIRGRTMQEIADDSDSPWKTHTHWETHTHTHTLAQTNKPAHSPLMVRIDWLIERGTEGMQIGGGQSTGGDGGADPSAEYQASCLDSNTRRQKRNSWCSMQRLWPRWFTHIIKYVCCRFFYSFVSASNII